MLFPAFPRTAPDIRDFCATFNEGIRVEYKGTLDDNVRRALPKVVSSFANSLGGVLIIGVNAQDGVPQNPIEGFTPPAEELPLTIENLCVGGINPPVFPRTTVIDSDVAGRQFIVIEVDESWEAPHAIENSKKVYVRTGNAANPYDLAEVDLIIDLVRRRSEPRELRERMLQAARQRASTAVADTSIYAEASITPMYPRRPLCTRDATWDFMSTQMFRRGRFFPLETLRRVEDGVASFRANEEYGQLNTFGVLLGMKVMQPTQAGFLLVGDPLRLMLKLMIAAARFYANAGYRGDVEIGLTLQNVRNQRMVFIPGVMLETLYENDYRSYETSLSGRQIIPSENLQRELSQNLNSVIAQVCWPFWQSAEAFPSEDLRLDIERIVREMGRL
ncbi:MAG: helix-turn-helix domain-containing protein [Terriglobales bacterium]